MVKFNPKFYLTLGKTGEDTVYIKNSEGDWIEFSESYEFFKIIKRQNQMYEFELILADIESSDKLIVKEFAEVLFFSENNLILKGRIQKVTYGTGFQVVCKGFGMEAKTLDKELKKYGKLLRNGEEAKADVLIVRSRTRVDKDYIDKAKNLKLIIRAGAGLDNIEDIEYCKKKGIKVENIPEASSISVAELVFAHMLAIARNVIYCTNTIKKCEWRKKELVGFELHGRSLGIIGLGRIGKAVAKIAEAFGMTILAYDPFVKSSEYELVELSQLLKKSDIITLHVPLTKGTKHMIGKNEFRLMKNDVVIINTSRGSIIDEDELIKNLRKFRPLGFSCCNPL